MQEKLEPHDNKIRSTFQKRGVVEPINIVINYYFYNVLVLTSVSPRSVCPSPAQRRYRPSMRRIPRLYGQFSKLGSHFRSPD